MKGKTTMPKYRITETAVYYVEAADEEEAEAKFLDAIELTDKNITTEVVERDVELDVQA